MYIHSHHVHFGQSAALQCHVPFGQFTIAHKNTTCLVMVPEDTWARHLPISVFLCNSHNTSQVHVLHDTTPSVVWLHSSKADSVPWGVHHDCGWSLQNIHVIEPFSLSSLQHWIWCNKCSQNPGSPWLCSDKNIGPALKVVGGDRRLLWSHVLHKAWASSYGSNVYRHRA